MSRGFDWDLADHDNFVIARGDVVLWSRATKCACGSPEEPTRANPNCRTCGGWGWFYGPETSLVGLVTGLRSERALLAAGIAQPGDMMLGLSPLDPTRIGDWDRVRLTWPEGQPYEGDVLVRRLYGPDTLMYEPSTIFSVQSVDALGGTVTPWVQGVDFTVTGRELTWVVGHGPPPDTTYSVAYHVKAFDWICFVSPQQRFEAGRSLGLKVLLRKRHVVTRAVPF